MDSTGPGWRAVRRLLREESADAADYGGVVGQEPTSVVHVRLRTIAAPITGLVRTLNALIAGVAIQLQQIAEKGLVSGEAPAPAEAAPEPEPEAAPEETEQESAPDEEPSDA